MGAESSEFTVAGAGAGAGVSEYDDIVRPYSNDTLPCFLDTI